MPLARTVVQRLGSRADLVRVAAGLVRAAAAEAVARRGLFSIALAGGSTPKPLYETLAADQYIEWARWQLFWGDERTVPPDHPESNYRMVERVLLKSLSARRTPPALVARMQGELPPDDAAALYAERLRVLPTDPLAGALPRFDLVLLGMGADGHTASLFPHTPALTESEKWVAANPVPQLDTTRLTLTFPVLNAARHVLFLVSGADKADALRAVLEGPPDVATYPSQGVRPVAGRLTWLIDADASAALASTTQDPH
jgi:6-phosphogluconolactonase